jgi:hypothetical protein
MSEEVADWIADTREYIEKNGWWRGGYRGPNGRQACVVGGILFSHNLTHDAVHDPRVVEVAKAICQVFPPQKMWGYDSLDTIYNWNDDHDTKKQEVLDTLAKAEKIERAGYDSDAA